MQQQQAEPTFGQQVNALFGFGHCLATVPKLFTRSPPMGERANGFATLIGLILAYLIVGLGDPIAANTLIGASLVMLFLHRFTGKSREGIHSGYDGKPWICKLGFSELRAKAVFEPMLLLFASAGLMCASPALGLWLLLATIGMVFSFDHWRLRMKAQLRAVKDAEIEGAVFREYREKGMH